VGFASFRGFHAPARCKARHLLMQLLHDPLSLSSLVKERLRSMARKTLHPLIVMGGLDLTVK